MFLSFENVYIDEISLITVCFDLGEIEISLEGPEKTQLNIQNNDNNSITVTFTPQLPAIYKVHVNCSGSPIPGSPFVCKVSGVRNAGQIFGDA